MRADWVHHEELKHLLAALMPENRLAMEISLATGLRISDVLGIKTEAIKASKDRRISVREQKTGKTRRVKLPVELYECVLKYAGRLYVFEGRLDWRRPRTRQAVYKDLKRISQAFRCKGNVTPHSARKAYAVKAYERTGDIKRVQQLLNHGSEAVTMLYALADELTARRMGTKAKGPQRPS